MKPESPWRRRLLSGLGLLGVTVIITATQPAQYWATDSLEGTVTTLGFSGEAVSVPLVVTLTTPSLVNPGDGSIEIEIEGSAAPSDTSEDTADTDVKPNHYQVLVTLEDECGTVEQADLAPQWDGDAPRPESLALGFRARASEPGCGDCAFSDNSCQVFYTLTFELLEGPGTEIGWSASAWYHAYKGWCRGYPEQDTSLLLDVAGAT